MTDILQRIYLFALNGVGRFTLKASIRIRRTVVFCSLLAAFSIIPLTATLFGKSLDLTLTQWGVIGSALLFVTIIFIINKPLGRVRWNSFACALYFICGFTIFLPSFIHSTGPGVRVTALLMLIGFPCLYFVLSNFSIEEREHYARLVALTALISSGFIVIISFAMCVSINYSAEMLERYEGVTRHANLLAMLCVCTMASALYLISALRSKKRFLNFILIAMSIYILLQTGSRTSFIAAICIFVVWLIAKKDKTLHKNIRRLTKNIIVTAIIAIAVALIFVFAYRPGFFSALPEIFTVLSERFGSGIQGGVDQYSSGRIEIWQYCIDHVNLFGNDYYDSVFVTKDGFIQYYCHNTPIEFMYRCGAPAGVMYLIFEVFVAIQILRRMFSKNSIRKYELLFCMFATAYLVESMLDVQVFPFDTRALVLGFFMTLHPLFEKNHVDEKQ